MPPRLRNHSGGYQSRRKAGTVSRNIQTAGPFCWQEKTALRKIREACGNVGDGASTLATYLALTEIASDKQSDAFQTTQEYIAGKACLSLATVKRRLKLLSELGLIEITVPKLRAPGTYRLLQIAHNKPAVANNEPAIAQGRKRVKRATLEEYKEEYKEGEPLARNELSAVPDFEAMRRAMQ